MSKCPDPDCKEHLMDSIVGKYTFWTVIGLFVLIFGTATGWIARDMAKAADVNAAKIEKNTDVIQANAKMAAIIAEQIKQIKEQLARDDENQRQRDILILEKLERLLNGD